jgi:hypothetical protein
MVDMRLAAAPPRSVLFALALAVAAGAAPLTGTVTCGGRPAAGARITFAAAGIRVLADSTGAFSVPMPTALAPFLPRAAGATARRDGAGTPRFRAADRWVRGDGRVALPGPVTMARGGGLAKGASGNTLTVSARGCFEKDFAISPGQTRAEISLERDRRRHMWVWDNDVVTRASARDSLFAFGKRKGVGTFYVHAGGILGTQDAALAAFLDAAEAEGYSIELLFGTPEWALTANHPKVAALAKQAAALAARQDQALRTAPVGIQFDVEPYGLDEYSADPDAVGSQWVDMYLAAAAALAGSGVGLTACVPRWLETRSVTRAGKARPLNEWLADVSDRLTLMDYVDKAKGILDGAAEELAYADDHGKEVVVGVETMAGLDPPSVTFAEEGEAAMEAALAADEPEFRKHPSYVGTAIHHWRAYETLKP